MRTELSVHCTDLYFLSKHVSSLHRNSGIYDISEVSVNVLQVDGGVEAQLH
jgi:hypothetical protein